jgi:endoglucanase
MMSRPLYWQATRWRRRGVVSAAAVSAALLAIPAEAEANPLAGVALYVSPGSEAKKTSERWRRSRPEDAAALAFIARQPVAYWVGDFRGNVRRNVSAVMARSRSARATPVLVVYNIPHRDCGAHSRGGESDGVRYKRWIREFAAGLGKRRAIVILEPDALAGADCLDPETRRERYELLRDAVFVLKAAKATVYIDAGHARWLAPEVTARRLIETGIHLADGFALNVSNYVDNATTIAYGDAISRRVGGKHFVIDTSRNGLGTAHPSQWCNAAGQALGMTPTTRTGHALVDGFLWIKHPGESDGSCRGGPVAGVFWPAYALDLVKRALALRG